MKNIVELNQDEIAVVSGGYLAELGNGLGAVLGTSFGLYCCFRGFIKGKHNITKTIPATYEKPYTKGRLVSIETIDDSEFIKCIVITYLYRIVGSTSGAAIGRFFDKRFGWE